MKKRKELDALLMNNMNVKKLGKSSGSIKEGHELLRNEASWDSNSTENDEFFSPPRRLTIRRPPRWRFCATGIQLCVFVVMVACIVVTGGLVWMHLDLKQDLDELRLRIAKVESELETSTEQASTVSTLQIKIEQLQKLPVQINIINRQIGSLNLTNSQLNAKLKAVKDEIQSLPTAGIEGLQQSTAQIGSTLQGVQSLQTQHTGQMDTLTNSLQLLQTSLTDLQGDVGKLQQAALVPTPKPSDPTSDTPNPSGLLSIKTAVQSLQQEEEAMSLVVTKLNSTVATFSDWKQALMPRIVALESTPHTSDPTDSALADKVDQLQSQVNTLTSTVHSQAPGGETGHQTSSPIAGDTPTDWRHAIESEIQAIQTRVDQLNPQDVNNNLLNPNVTRDLQHQIERSLGVFKQENLKSVDDLKQDNRAIWGRVYQQHSDFAALQKDVDALKVRVQDLKNKTGHMLTPVDTTSQTTDFTTAEFSTQQMTSDMKRSVTIAGMSTLEDIEKNFFIMDNDQDDFLTTSELSNFLGPTLLDQLMKFDKNQDNKLDLDEFKTALGFPEQ